MLKEKIQELGLVTWVCILVVVVFIILGTGGLVYKKTIGVENANADRQIFEENASRVNGMVRDLADYKRQYDEAKDDIEKKAIKDLICDKFANFEASKIENDRLRSFLTNIRGY